MHRFGRHMSQIVRGDQSYAVSSIERCVLIQSPAQFHCPTCRTQQSIIESKAVL
jgi:hypothetical protein